MTERNKHMFFSIIIPAHNEERNISKLLDSIKAQSFTDYEVIVVCDACEDETESIAKSYGAVTISVNNHTDGLTRNAGIEKARGDWILFIDADDWYVHEYVLQQLFNRLQEITCDILCYGIIWKGIGYVSPISGRGDLYPHCTNKVWRREFIGDNRFPNKEVASDASFHEGMMRKHPKIEMIEMPIYYYNYLREGSKSDTLGRTVEHTKAYWRIN